jgi:hypothetical protein
LFKLIEEREPSPGGVQDPAGRPTASGRPGSGLRDHLRPGQYHFFDPPVFPDPGNFYLPQVTSTVLVLSRLPPPAADTALLSRVKGLASGVKLNNTLVVRVAAFGLTPEDMGTIRGQRIDLARRGNLSVAESGREYRIVEMRKINHQDTKNTKKSW